MTLSLRLNLTFPKLPPTILEIPSQPKCFDKASNIHHDTSHKEVRRDYCIDKLLEKYSFDINKLRNPDFDILKICPPERKFMEAALSKEDLLEERLVISVGSSNSLKQFFVERRCLIVNLKLFPEFNSVGSIMSAVEKDVFDIVFLIAFMASRVIVETKFVEEGWSNNHTGENA
ncbi:hypothetical protein AVEN_95483-1 [Araneus ventricosus]|uniref:Uncharacterized protein n=1 Tax=Araneus ventricosus TaxID=182803 RepID=A0A4Y2RA11_ARAVE|nr:hypothetical protein AVEN_95483-1 [Araneus ventricosus]